MSIRDQLPRTECDCEACQIGCRTLPGMCGVGDVARIAEHAKQQSREGDHTIGFHADIFIETHFVASEGAKVARYRSDGSVEVFQIPTIVPAQRENGECVFYRDGRCAIHAVSPLGCSHVDPHMTKEQGNAVVHPALAEIMADQQADGPYWRLWQHLVAAGRVARPRAERRAAFERELAAVRASLPPKPPQDSLPA